MITHKGETRSLIEWAEVLGIKRTTITQRIDYYKWSLDKALSN